MKKSRFDNSRHALMLELVTVDPLILDDFAIETMTKEQSKDIYQLLVERTGSASTIITSNRDTSQWLAMLDDMLLAQSAVDRFKNKAYDFVMDGESYRPRLKPKLAADAPPLYRSSQSSSQELQRNARRLRTSKRPQTTHWPL